MDVLDRKLQILEERDHFSSIERTRGAVDRLLPTLRAAKDPALRDIYVAKVAERTGVRRETLEAELASGGPPVPSQARARARASVPRGPAPRPSNLGPERKLLLLLVQFRDYVERAAERVAPEEFSDPTSRLVFEALVADPELSYPPAGLEPAAARKLEELLGDPERLTDASRVFDETVGQLKEVPITRRAEQLRASLREETDPVRQQELFLEIRDLDQQRRELRADWRTAIRPRHEPAESPHQKRNE